jgi:hypothetical protein
MREPLSGKTTIIEVPVEFEKAVRAILNYTENGGFGKITITFQDYKITPNGIEVMRRIHPS